MIEVMLAVLVLGLVVTASLKLVGLSQRGLSQVRETEILLDEVAKMQIELIIDPTNTFGISGDIEWNVMEQEDSIWLDDKIDIESLGFGENEIKEQIDKLREQKLRWRELEVKRNDKSIIVFLPYSEEAALAASDDVGSLQDATW